VGKNLETASQVQRHEPSARPFGTGPAKTENKELVLNGHDDDLTDLAIVPAFLCKFSRNPKMNRKYAKFAK
jgi:hypothetical protein